MLIESGDERADITVIFGCSIPQQRDRQRKDIREEQHQAAILVLSTMTSLYPAGSSASRLHRRRPGLPLSEPGCGCNSLLPPRPQHSQRLE
ncbi:hypothetical protein TRV_02749 [Trichophyton verrucosum HKI 0517]|uniref:Uncharacterized protein n=1 Tax=Trichophyton verrucosum (strain HKI 0517) TaxID=663202 RepID=D4D6M2_TRIVH|nr:uncharacterized protein TRV_02749 [Trichophyton verrucosum HKI 0517]EFE42510.1 hypothetical protein TRV_02749 [Trichophyton verrucosum HKI 0517]